jgi:hypothetical protein
MRKQTVWVVLVIAALLIGGALTVRSMGGGVISRWVAAHRSNAGH